VVGGILKFIQGLIGTLARTGRLPVLNSIIKAHKAGLISRKDFFRRVIGMGKEANLQGKYMSALTKFDNNKLLGKAILDDNKSLISKLGLVTKEAMRRQKISDSQKILHKAKKLLKNPTQLKKQRKGFADYQAYEASMDEGSLNPTASMIRDMRKTFSKANVSDKEMAKMIAQESSNSFGTYPSSKILAKVREKFGVTANDAKKMKEAKHLSKHGYSDSFKDVDLQKYFKTREAYSDYSGLDHVKVTQYGNPNYMASGKYDKPSFPGQQIASVPGKTPGKSSENILTDAWKELKKEFLKGYKA